MGTDADTDIPYQPSGDRAGVASVAGHGPFGGVVRLLPVVVIVVSEDRCFRAAATMLLSRRGCSVLAAADEAEALGQAAAQLVDVLVIEPAAHCSEPARAARALASSIDAAGATAGRRVAPVGVIVVGEPERLGEALDAEAGTPLPVLDKWGPFERLYQAICDRDRARRLPAAEDVERRPGALRGLGSV